MGNATLQSTNIFDSLKYILTYHNIDDDDDDAPAMILPTLIVRINEIFVHRI